MTNRDRLIAALCGTLGNGGEAMQCPYMWVFRLTHYAGRTQVCSHKDGTAAPDMCQRCIEQWLDKEAEV